MFVWYLTMNLYAHLLAIRNHQDLNSYKEIRFLDYLRSNNYPVSAPMEECLRSIGDVRDLAGADYRLAFPVGPNEGHFGQIGPLTYSYYESMPAPIICAEQI
ncbi:hypothetical protein B7P43_G12610 [Cryptotermes secundus]|uniref:Uncharacterized protein n=1 Tax=Cryptotermes secundus TaxID=105785 RepID=A0A2J7QKI1_9NEOP|nr:hypothetical protein B7P43_G12610 [Cryptotermes secundus]